jgi:hypothetical protein
MRREGVPGPAPRVGPSRRTKAAAILVLACLAALAAYAMFSGPTTIPSMTVPHGAPARTAAPPPGDEGGEGDR